MASSISEAQPPMSFCIVGAGAIGGMMGAFLAHGGSAVTFVDLAGPHLDAIKTNGGMRLLTPDGREIFGSARGVAKMEEVGKVDCVILALKANTLPHIVESLPSLLHEDTMVVTIQNGIPFWYFMKHGGGHANKPIRSVDPDGVLVDSIDADRLIGCIAYPAAHVAEPGVIQHVEGNRFPVGEIDGSNSMRLSRLADTFSKSGLKSPKLIGDIKDSKGLRAETWLKLWGNLCFNPISALTHSTLESIATCESTRRLSVTAMEEAQAVANKLEITFRTSVEKRVEGARKVGKHKTSMLQDVEAGRLTEIDSMVGSVCELGELVGVPTPSIYALYACMRLVNHKIRNEKTRVVSFAGDEYDLQPLEKDETSLIDYSEIRMNIRAPDRLGLLRDYAAVVARNDGNIGICKGVLDADGFSHFLLTFEAPVDKRQRIIDQLRALPNVALEVSDCDSDYRNNIPMGVVAGAENLALSTSHLPKARISGICTDRPGVLKTFAALLLEHGLNVEDIETYQRMVPIQDVSGHYQNKQVAAFVFEVRVHCPPDIDMKILEENFVSASRILGGSLEFTHLSVGGSSFASSKQIAPITPVAVRSKM